MSREQPQIPGLDQHQYFDTGRESATPGRMQGNTLFREPVYNQSTSNYEENISPTCILDRGHDIGQPSLGPTRPWPDVNEDPNRRQSTTMPVQENVVLPSNSGEQDDNGCLSQEIPEDENDDLFNGYEPTSSVELPDKLVESASSTSAPLSHDAVTQNTTAAPGTEDAHAPEKELKHVAREPAAKNLKTETKSISRLSHLPDVFTDPNFFPLARSVGGINNSFLTAEGDRLDTKNMFIVWDHVEPPERKAYIATVGAWLADDRNFADAGLEWPTVIRQLWAFVSSRWEDEDACARDIFPVVTDAYLLQLLRFNICLRLIGEKVQARAENENAPARDGHSFHDDVSQRHENKIRSNGEPAKPDASHRDVVDCSNTEATVNIAQPHNSIVGGVEVNTPYKSSEERLESRDRKEEYSVLTEDDQSRGKEIPGGDKAEKPQPVTTLPVPPTVTENLGSPKHVHAHEVELGIDTKTQEKRAPEEPVEPRPKVKRLRCQRLSSSHD